MGKTNVDLTARYIDSLNATSKKYHFDSQVKGLCVRVTPNGVKSFQLYYRHEGRPRSYTLAQVGVISLEEARDQAIDLKRAVRDGKDPGAEKKRERLAFKTPIDVATKLPETFAEIGAEFIEKHSKPKKKSWKEDQRILNRYLNDAFGPMKASEIERAQIRRLLQDIAQRGAAVQSNRVLALVRKIYNWAIDGSAFRTAGRPRKSTEISISSCIRPKRIGVGLRTTTGCIG